MSNLLYDVKQKELHIEYLRMQLVEANTSAARDMFTIEEHSTEICALRKRKKN